MKPHEMEYKTLSSDDEFDNSNGYNEQFSADNSVNNINNGYNGNNETGGINTNGMSKAELRKTTKPIMEKRRRARINQCLNDLKLLILEATNKDPNRHNKLEKADILEMTVKYLQSLQRQQLNLAMQSDPSVLHKFRSGFAQCAEEANRYIGQLDDIDQSVRQRLTHHLKNCAVSLEPYGSMTNFGNGFHNRQLNNSNVLNTGYFGGVLNNTLAMSSTTPVNFPTITQDQNNNNNNSSNNNNTINNNNNMNLSSNATTNAIQMGGMQLIPSRLPSGEFALIMPRAHAASNAGALIYNNNSNNNNNITNNNLNSWTASATPTAPATTTTATPQGFQSLSAFSKPLPNKTTTTTVLLMNNNNNNNNNNNFKDSNRVVTETTTTSTTLKAENIVKQEQQSHQQTTVETTKLEVFPTPHNIPSSPPLSPISSPSASCSSHNEDSNMHTSSDFASSRTITPPVDVSNRQHNFSGVFSTPSSINYSSASSSGCSSTISSPSNANLQQQQVTSTSGSDVNNATIDPNTPSRKRTHHAIGESTNEEPLAKKIISPVQEKWECEAKEKESKDHIPKRPDQAHSIVINKEYDYMWRPW